MISLSSADVWLPRLIIHLASFAVILLLSRRKPWRVSVWFLLPIGLLLLVGVFVDLGLDTLLISVAVVIGVVFAFDKPYDALYRRVMGSERLNTPSSRAYRAALGHAMEPIMPILVEGEKKGWKADNKALRKSLSELRVLRGPSAREEEAARRFESLVADFLIERQREADTGLVDETARERVRDQFDSLADFIDPGGAALAAHD